MIGWLKYLWLDIIDRYKKIIYKLIQFVFKVILKTVCSSAIIDCMEKTGYENSSDLK